MSKGTWLQALGKGAQMAGTYLEGMAIVNSMMDEADLINMSAADYDLQAQHAKKATSHNDRLIRLAGLEAEGRIVNQAGKAGLAVSGTMLDRVKATAQKVELEAIKQKEEGIHAYNRYTRAGHMARQKASDLQAQASKTKTATIWKTVASIF